MVPVGLPPAALTKVEMIGEPAANQGVTESYTGQGRTAGTFTRPFSKFTRRVVFLNGVSVSVT